MINTVIAILFILYGGFISRFHGGAFKGGVNKTLKNFLWALPHAVAIFLINPWLAPLGFINMLKATGHGRFLGSDEPMRQDMKPEKAEYAILWLEDKISTRVYKHIGMALTGFLALLGSVIAFMFIDPLAALIIAIGALLKGVAYEIGTFILPKQTKSGIKHFMYKTEIGEFITGIFAYGGLAIGFAIS
jgi:hypothetical protein